jgi:tetratricopeptide (TPR) repeat protein
MRIELGRSILGLGSTLDPVGLAPFQVLSLEQALVELERCAASLPRQASPHYHRARGFLKLERDAEALHELDLAERIDPGFVPALLLRSLILEKQGDPAAARAQLDRVEAFASGSWATDWLSAQRAAMARDWSEAERAFARLLALEQGGVELYLGSSVETLLGRGLARLEAKLLAGAIEDFRAAEVLWPEATEPVLLKVRAYNLLGERETADALLEDLFVRSGSSA